MVQEITGLRGVSCLFAVLSYLQDEPVCRKCSAFARVIEQSREKFQDIERSLGRNRAVPEEIRELFSHIYRVLSGLKMPDKAVRQKKEGDCGFPAGLCMAKHAIAICGLIEAQGEQKTI